MNLHGLRVLSFDGSITGKTESQKKSRNNKKHGAKGSSFSVINPALAYNKTDNTCETIKSTTSKLARKKIKPFEQISKFGLFIVSLKSKKLHERPLNLDSHKTLDSLTSNLCSNRIRDTIQSISRKRQNKRKIKRYTSRNDINVNDEIKTVNTGKSMSVRKRKKINKKHNRKNTSTSNYYGLFGFEKKCRTFDPYLYCQLGNNNIRNPLQRLRHRKRKTQRDCDFHKHHPIKPITSCKLRSTTEQGHGCCVHSSHYTVIDFPHRSQIYSKTSLRLYNNNAFPRGLDCYCSIKDQKVTATAPCLNGLTKSKGDAAMPKNKHVQTSSCFKCTTQSRGDNAASHLNVLKNSRSTFKVKYKPVPDIVSLRASRVRAPQVKLMKRNAIFQKIICVKDLNSKPRSLGKIVLLYTLFVLIILVGSPCVIVIAFGWLFTYPLRPHDVLTGNKTKSGYACTSKCERKKRTRPDQCSSTIFISCIKCLANAIFTVYKILKSAKRPRTDSKRLFSSKFMEYQPCDNSKSRLGLLNTGTGQGNKKYSQLSSKCCKYEKNDVLLVSNHDISAVNPKVSDEEYVQSFSKRDRSTIKRNRLATKHDHSTTKLGTLYQECVKTTVNCDCLAAKQDHLAIKRRSTVNPKGNLGYQLEVPDEQCIETATKCKCLVVKRDQFSTKIGSSAVNSKVSDIDNVQRASKMKCACLTIQSKDLSEKYAQPDSKRGHPVGKHHRLGTKDNLCVQCEVTNHIKSRVSDRENILRSVNIKCDCVASQLKALDDEYAPLASKCGQPVDVCRRLATKDSMVDRLEASDEEYNDCKCLFGKKDHFATEFGNPSAKLRVSDKENVQSAAKIKCDCRNNQFNAMGEEYAQPTSKRDLSATKRRSLAANGSSGDQLELLYKEDIKTATKCDCHRFTAKTSGLTNKHDSLTSKINRSGTKSKISGKEYNRSASKGDHLSAKLKRVFNKNKSRSIKSKITEGKDVQPVSKRRGLAAKLKRLAIKLGISKPKTRSPVKNLNNLLRSRSAFKSRHSKAPLSIMNRSRSPSNTKYIDKKSGFFKNRRSSTQNFKHKQSYYLRTQSYIKSILGLKQKEKLTVKEKVFRSCKSFGYKITGKKQNKKALWPAFKCRDMYLHALREKPCFWVYRRWPSKYRRFLYFYKDAKIACSILLVSVALFICCPFFLCYMCFRLNE